MKTIRVNSTETYRRRAVTMLHRWILAHHDPTYKVEIKILRDGTIEFDARKWRK